MAHGVDWVDQSYVGPASLITAVSIEVKIREYISF